jgi:hypothetical protein
MGDCITIYETHMSQEIARHNKLTLRRDVKESLSIFREWYGGNYWFTSTHRDEGVTVYSSDNRSASIWLDSDRKGGDFVFVSLDFGTLVVGGLPSRSAIRSLKNCITQIDLDRQNNPSIHKLKKLIPTTA